MSARIELGTYDSLSTDLNVAHAVVYASAMALGSPGADASVIASALEFAAEWIDTARANFRHAYEEGKSTQDGEGADQ